MLGLFSFVQMRSPDVKSGGRLKTSAVKTNKIDNRSLRFLSPDARFARSGSRQYVGTSFSRQRNGNYKGVWWMPRL